MKQFYQVAYYNYGECEVGPWYFKDYEKALQRAKVLYDVHHRLAPVRSLSSLPEYNKLTKEIEEEYDFLCFIDVASLNYCEIEKAEDFIDTINFED